MTSDGTPMGCMRRLSTGEEILFLGYQVLELRCSNSIISTCSSKNTKP